MKAMIFAAGLGTRLKPLTDEIPKALLKFNEIPIIEYSIKKAIKYGFDEIIINVHHHYQKIIDYIQSNNCYNINIKFSIEKDLLLETGGGLKNAKWFFDDNKPFLVFNCDTISDINFLDFYNQHLKSNALITLAVRNRITNRYFLFDDDMKLIGWLNKAKNQKILLNVKSNQYSEFAFSGIQVMNPEVFELMPDDDVFSLTELYLKIGKTNIIKGFDHTSDFWIDIGKKDEYERLKNVDLNKYL